MKGILIGVFIYLVAALTLYLFSRLQMRAWMDEFNAQFKKKSEDIKQKVIQNFKS